MPTDPLHAYCSQIQAKEKKRGCPVDTRENQVERLEISSRSRERGWRKLGNVCFCTELKSKNKNQNPAAR